MRDSLHTASHPAIVSVGKSAWEWEPYLTTAIRAVLWVYVAVLPFNGLLVIERNGFLLLLVLLAVWSLAQRRLFYVPTPLDVPLLLFVGWIAVTIPFAQFPAYSFKEFGKLLQGVVVFYAVQYFLGDGLSRKRLVYLLLGVTALVSTYGMTQYNPTNMQAVRSFLSSEVWLTTYLVMLLPLGFGVAYGESHVWRRSVGITVGLLALGCLVLTRSRAGAVSAMVELTLLAWFLRSRKAVAFGALTALICAGVLWGLSFTNTAGLESVKEVVPMNKNVGSIIHRYDIWKFTLAEIQRHPFVGIGYGKDNFLLVYGDRQEQIEPGHAKVMNAGTHNIFLYYALHTGIPGLLVFLFFAGMILRVFSEAIARSPEPSSRGILVAMTAGVIGLMIRLQFDQMFVGTLAVLFWIMLAIGLTHMPNRKHMAAG